MASLPDAPAGIYEEFADAAAEFRILHLHPGNHYSAIECELEIIKKADKPTYSALSYTWGPVEGGKTIIVNGKNLIVTNNCESALRHIRREDSPTTLWIDAICIEQSNLEEKSAQIGQMRNVYRSAAEVIVWLGDNANEWSRTSEAFALLTKISTNDQFTSNRSGCWAEETIPDWLDIDYLLNQEWFERIWIIQEVLLAKYITICCGYNRISWTTFHKALQRCRAKMHPSEDGPTGRGSVVMRYELLMNEWEKQYWTGAVEQNLEYLLARFSTWKATVPLDKVNALLGLSSEHAVPGLQPDYTKSTSQVFANVVKYYIGHKRQLSILGQCQNPSVCQGLPSWVPDWTRDSHPRAHFSGLCCPDAAENSEHLIAFRKSLSKSSTDFRATLHMPAESWFPSVHDDLVFVHRNGPATKQEETMRLKGIALDNVDFVTKSVNRPTEVGQSLAYPDFLLDWETFAIVQMPPNVKCPYGGTLDQKLDTFWRTISTDRVCQEDDMPRATPSCRQLFEHWRSDSMRPAEPDGVRLWDDTFRPFNYSEQDSGSVICRLTGNPFATPESNVRCDPGLLERYVDWRRSNAELKSPAVIPPTAPLDSRKQFVESQFARTVRIWCESRKLARTASGRLALVPEHTRSGDKVVLLYGGNVPYVIRTLPGRFRLKGYWKDTEGLHGASGAYYAMHEEMHQFIGEAYVHGIMDGEAMEHPQTLGTTPDSDESTQQEHVAEWKESLKRRETLFWFDSFTLPV